MRWWLLVVVPVVAGCSPSTRCGSDADCKGDRVCDSGTCRFASEGEGEGEGAGAEATVTFNADPVVHLRYDDNFDVNGARFEFDMHDDGDAGSFFVNIDAAQFPTGAPGPCTRASGSLGPFQIDGGADLQFEGTIDNFITGTSNTPGFVFTAESSRSSGSATEQTDTRTVDPGAIVAGCEGH